MLEIFKRKKVDKQDKQIPQSIEQLIEYYDLEKLWKYLENIAKFVNDQETAITETNKEIEETNKKICKVTDSLESDSSVDALSANQGKVLNEKIEGTILYEDEAGFNTSTSDILSDSIENYRYREIIYKRSTSVNTTGKITNDHGMTSVLQTASSSGQYITTLGLENKDAMIGYSYKIPYNSTSPEETTDVCVIKIIGYK